MEIDIEKSLEEKETLRDKALREILQTRKDYLEFEERISQERYAHKVKMAEAITNAKVYEIGTSDVAQLFGLSNQAIYKLMLEVYGVRYPEKSEAAKLRITYDENS